MRADMVRWFIIATLEAQVSTVFHSNQPNSPDDCVAVYSEQPRLNVKSDVRLAEYQAIVRNTNSITGEANAETILDAVRSNHNLKTYDGMYLSGAMSGTSDPVTFAPDDNGGTPASTASAFTAGDYILIGSIETNDAEILKVTLVDGDDVTASRAQLGTTIAAHSNNDEVYNITRSPVPGELCDSTRATTGVLPMGLDEKNRWEFAVNWQVTLKP